MKLRTIALAGLLGTGLLMSSGCGGDSVKDAIESALKLNVVHVANGMTKEVQFTVKGNVDGESQVVKAQKNKMFVLSGKDSYQVTNTEINAPHNFGKDSAHLYALCANGTGVMVDTATAGDRKIEVFNLSEKNLGDSTASVNIALYGASDNLLSHASPTAGYVGSCNKAGLSFTPSDFKLVDVKKVQFSINGSDFNVTVPNYDKDVQAKLAKLNSVDFNIVVYDLDQEKATIVPLATPKQLDK